MFIYDNVCVYIMYVHVCECVYIYICVCMYIYIYVRVCVYVYYMSEMQGDGLMFVSD